MSILSNSSIQQMPLSASINAPAYKAKADIYDQNNIQFLNDILKNITRTWNLNAGKKLYYIILKGVITERANQHWSCLMKWD